MARNMRTSTALVIGKKRLAGLQSFEVQPKMGPVTEKVVADAISKLETLLGDYNKNIAEGNLLRIQIKSQEVIVNDLAARVLSGTATNFGKDSPEYEKVGGTKTSERKRPGQRKKELAERKRSHKRAAPPSHAGTAPPVGGDSSSTSLA